MRRVYSATQEPIQDTVWAGEKRDRNHVRKADFPNWTKLSQFVNAEQSHPEHQDDDAQFVEPVRA